ncbi:MAG: type II 3-dehydroquinate dehydratase [Actinomycetota bacterium]|jgi:3-dehydroquinate dehydratase-2|nr:type II 3-dehydroquinate dehydratase [Actinomycetota bacterium]
MSGRDRAVIVLLSGPNLQLFGERHPEVYGRETLAEQEMRARHTAEELGYALEHVQSDAEAELVAAVHEARGRAAALVVNAGALTHYGWSLSEALASFGGVVVELHVSNPDARERWRRRSVIAPVADGTVAGFGGLGYELAVEAAARLLSEREGG